MGNLNKYLNKPVKELISRKTNTFEESEKERMRIYSNLLFAITAHFFNGQKYGPRSKYALNPKYSGSDSYFGHNIAALAVNKYGEVIDFEFNHNKIFDSSVEHAESRLIRRLFSLTQVYQTWEERINENRKYSNLLSEVTVYTTLESCTQCTGIMTLGDVKNVVYLQDDPGMYHIGNIVKNLTENQGYIEAPLPISGREIGFKSYDLLNQEFEKFKKQQANKTGDPFVIDPSNNLKYSDSITSFLCTKSAYDIFNKCRIGLTELKLSFQDFKPFDTSKTNEEVLTECKNFYCYAVDNGNRATPHRM